MGYSPAEKLVLYLEFKTSYVLATRGRSSQLSLDSCKSEDHLA